VGEKKNKTPASQPADSVLLLIELIRAAAEIDTFVYFGCALLASEGVINHNTQVRHLTEVLSALITPICIDRILPINTITIKVYFK